MSSPTNPSRSIPIPKGETSPQTLHHIPLIEGRRNSFSGKSLNSNKPPLPAEPASPSQISSPRLHRSQNSSPLGRFRSISDSENTDKIPNISQNRTKLILEILERNDSNEMQYKKSQNCCIFPSEKSMEEKSFDEKKFMKREFPSYFSTERQFFRFLMHQFDEALQGVEDRLPHYYSIDNLNEHQMKGLISELDLWFALFDECIGHESQKSSMNAYIMKQIMEVFQQDFLLLINQVKTEHKRYTNLIGAQRIKDEETETGRLQKEYEKVVAEKDRLKREMKQIQSEIQKNHYEKFQIKYQLDEANVHIRNLEETVEQLNDKIAYGNERINDLLKSKPSEALEATFTSVPGDVLETWTQCSQFLTAIMDDELTKLDFNSLFLDNMTKNDGTLGTFLTLPRPEVPTFEGTNVHYSKLIGLIKMFLKDGNSKTLFDIFSGKIRDLFKKFSIFYVDRVLQHRKGDREKESKLRKQIKDLRSSFQNPNDWMKIVLDSPDLFSIPKKGAPDVQSQMLFVYQQSMELMKKGLNKPRSASEIVKKCFSGDQLLLFLAQVSKLSNSDISADIFRMFVSNEMPYHMYLYYSKISAMNEKLDLFKRAALLTSQFKDFGINSIPQQKRRRFESIYCVNPVTFPIFMLAVYQHLIENISNEIADKVNKKDLINFLKEKYNDDELCEYLVAVSEKDDPSVIEYASVLFTFKKEKFPNALKNFDPLNSKVIEYMSTFGQKKETKKSPKKKSRASSRSPSRHIRPSSNNGEIPQISPQEQLDEKQKVDAAEETNTCNDADTLKADLNEEEEDRKEVNVMIDIPNVSEENDE